MNQAIGQASRGGNWIVMPVTLMLCLGLANAAVAAQWQEYRDTRQGFSASFPGEPQVFAVSYRLSDKLTVPARLITLSKDNSDYRLVVADFSNSQLDDDAVITKAEDNLRATGQVSVDIMARVRHNYGRQLAVTTNEGRHCIAAIFVVNRHLFEIQGMIHSTVADSNSSSIVRFQQSLDFF